MRRRAPVKLGKGHRIDRLAVLGEVPGRSIPHLRLTIGPYAVVRAFSIIYGGSHIGSHLETGHHVVIREENQIGDHLKIWNNSTIDYGCVLGNGVRIHNNVYVAQFTVLEDDVFLAPGVVVANDRRPISPEDLKGPTIKRGARVGINATLLPAIVIGEDALVGAGAVVTKDVPARAVVVGNPAHLVGTVDDLDAEKALEDSLSR